MITILIDSSRGYTRAVLLEEDKTLKAVYAQKNQDHKEGNVYLAKVSRVEPSLEVAFIDYGTSQSGFLSSSDIHVDYFQIPKADKEKILHEHQSHDEERQVPERQVPERQVPERQVSEGQVSEGQVSEGQVSEGRVSEGRVSEGRVPEDQPSLIEPAPEDEQNQGQSLEQNEHPESQNLELYPLPKEEDKKIYNIKEVIKREQVMVVQMTKNPRDKKGATLTTYLSLLGRCCILFPNTDRPCSISKKIANQEERKRIRSLLQSFNVPKGMRVVMRTASQFHSDKDVMQDYQELLERWETIRTTILESHAPSLIYQEPSLALKILRDYNTQNIAQVIVDGEDLYHDVENFMNKTFLEDRPKLTLHKGKKTLFDQESINDKMEELSRPRVDLPSGGSLVIHHTEALVSVDVNSGKSNHEHNVENTALKTNLEAATEIARQIQLRNIGGLIVIDFIDMYKNPSNRAVEKNMWNALSQDRARIQIGKISRFGLLELSRQRTSDSFFSSFLKPCDACDGSGSTLHPSVMAARSFDMLKATISNNSSQKDILLLLPKDIALHMLNAMREDITSLENQENIKIVISIDQTATKPIIKYVSSQKASSFSSSKKATDSRGSKPPPKHKRERKHHHNKHKQKNTSPRGTSAKDTNARDTSAKDTNARDTSAKDTSAKDTSAKDTQSLPSSPSTKEPKTQVPQTQVPQTQGSPDEDRINNIIAPLN